MTEAPLWVPVDLRDGNQALVEPMEPVRKRRMFELTLAIGFTEIEVGYPSASQTDFVRSLAEPGAVPEQVTVVVFTLARAELIERSFESIAGSPRAVVHLDTATAPLWREVVLGQDRDQLRQLILDAAGQIDRLAERHPGDVRFEFSPEVFNATEPDYALEVCNAVSKVWEADPDRPVIHNLPATVEIATPNVYADQIEFMHRNLERRDAVILSAHPHNDRGTGVACAELALLAGAQRVEGCLFGNGERTGNVDLVTLALNLHTQGVDSRLGFSDINEVRRTVEHCNRLGVHERHPYVGDLVHTAFSGTHQDAISKGLTWHARRAGELGVPLEQAPWEVPYLPIDPGDLGRDYAGVIRVNSRSGKGGIAYLPRGRHGLDLPRPLQIEFAGVVQRHTDGTGDEVDPGQLWELFSAEYLHPPAAAVALLDWRTGEPEPGGHWFTGTARVAGDVVRLEGSGPGQLAAFADALTALGITVQVLEYQEHSTGVGADAKAAAYVECRVDGCNRWGVGVDRSVLTASVHAVLSVVNRARPAVS